MPAIVKKIWNREQSFPNRVTLLATLIYVVTGTVWIVVSDQVLGDWVISAVGQELVVQTAKGIGFVLVTGTAFYFVLRFILVRWMERDEEAQRLLNHTPLTGLSNSRPLRAAASKALKSRSHIAGSAALIIANIDRLADVNTSLGMAAGDEVIRAVAHRIWHLVPDDALLGHPDSDNFYLLLTKVVSLADVAALASRVQAQFEEPVMIGERPISVTLSIGIAVGPDDGTTYDALVRSAELALRNVKAEEPGAAKFFTATLGTQAERRIAISSGLRNALRDGQYRIAVQPIVGVRDQPHNWYEALVRWEHPELGSLSPAEFIPIAESLEQIRGIDAWVLRNAAKWCASRAAAEHPASVAVNISARTATWMELQERVASALEKYSLPPGRLCIELTETAVISNFSGVVENLRAIRTMGVHVAIDDFGSHYSSIAYLTQLPADRLKLDRKMILGGLANSKAEREILGSVVGIAHMLDMEVVAEGIETEEQKQKMIDVGVDYCQGFLLGRPELQD